MKRTILAVMAMITLSFTAAPAVANANTILDTQYDEPSFPSQVQVVNIDDSQGLCLRTQPSEATKLSGYGNPHFVNGHTFRCIGVSGSYYRVTFRGGVYYIPIKFATGCGSCYTYHPATIVMRNVNDNIGVVLRTAPSDATKLGHSYDPHFYNGNTLPCTGQTANYYQVMYNGAYYYIPKYFAAPL